MLPAGPHMSSDGRRDAQTAGRSALPKIRQRSWLSSWTQGTPAGLPEGMPGMGLVMEGAMQQAPHPGRHARAMSSGTQAAGGPEHLVHDGAHGGVVRGIHEAACASRHCPHGRGRSRAPASTPG